MHRLFVAIRPPEHIRDLLIDAMDDSPELRWVSEDNLHLTLRFIGEVERPLAEELAAVLQSVRYPAFDVRVAGIGQFTQRRGGALWAGIEPRDRAGGLAARIERACQQAGLEPERRAFHPHVTLARFGRQSTAAAARLLERTRGLASDPWTVNAFTLFESRLSRHGAHYDAVANYKLS